MSASAVTSSPAPPLKVPSRELHVESLVGTHLRDESGTSLGRIEEIVVEIRGTDWVVVELHVGPGAMLGRVAELTTLVPAFGFLRRRMAKHYRVPWDQVDVSDPARPRATVRHGELVRVASSD